MFKSYVFFLLLFFAIKGYAQESVPAEPDQFSPGSFSVRSNLPTWLLAVPSLGLSYKTTDRFEFIVDGAYSHWNFKRKGMANYHNFWNISPQIRTYINHQYSTYIGLQYSMGEYNISRQQGRYVGGGLAIGKQYFAGKNLLIDIGLTLGYLKISKRESYQQENGDFYRIYSKENANYWGPTALSIRFSRKIN